MKKLLVAAVLGLPAVLGGLTGDTPRAAAQAGYGWRKAGPYRTYQAADRKADQLGDSGYRASVKKERGSWWVYYKR